MTTRIPSLAVACLIAVILVACGSPPAGGTSLPAGTRTPGRPGLVYGGGTPLPTPFACPPGSEEHGCLVVPGKANIFGAGLDEPEAPGGGGPGVLPPMWSVPPGTTTMRVTDATGAVYAVIGGSNPNGPEGDLAGPTDVSSYGGISGIVHGSNGMFLTGVFLTDEPPSGEGPDRLRYSGPDDFTEVAPAIAQTFLVGDGVGRTFVVPTGATRLYLGFADAYRFVGVPGWYDNNGGELVVTVEFAAD